MDNKINLNNNIIGRIERIESTIDKIFDLLRLSGEMHQIHRERLKDITDKIDGVSS